ncbi:MAG: helix-turn-helix domain-containing protein [Atopobiaceae bacterium]
MRVDLRVKHDVEARRMAAELFKQGHGYKSAAKALSVPRGTVRQWLCVYRSFGSEALLTMDGRQARYTYEQKVAAASAVVDGGATKAEAMAELGIMSRAPLERWCRLYREGGAEALRPKPRGRPGGSRARPRTREQELEERCRRLEAEVAYLKKLRALVERDGL